jgi:3'-5' exoribonuclease
VPAEQAERAARRKNVLLHVILSHHGRREWGAPVLPRTPEALLLHYCDVMSASLHKCFSAVEAAPEAAQWTDPVYVMDHARRMLVPSEPPAQTEDED